LPLLVPPVHKLFLLLYRIFIISGSLFYYHLCHIWLSFILAYIALIKFGVPEQNIIIDKASGKDTEREGYQYLKRQMLRKGDTLVIKELDRLSRNKSDIKRELEQLKDMGIRVKILDIPTTLTDFPPEQAWVLEMINAILIEVLGAIAENERNKIRARQREGIEAAKKKNVRFGRPSKPLPDNWEQVLADVRCGNKKPVEAMRELGISRSHYYRLYKSE